MPAGRTRQKSDAMMREVARRFEARIRKDPEQWYVFDPLWDAGEPVGNIARVTQGLEAGVSPLQ